MNDTYKLEGFAEPLRGRRIWVAAHPTVAAGRFAAAAQEFGHRERVVFVAPVKQALPKWTAACPAPDAVFRVAAADTTDMKLVLQYLQARTTPTICCWLGAEPPRAVFQYFARFSHVTLIVCSTGQPMEEYDACFWSAESGPEEVEAALIRRMGVRATQIGLAAVFKELRATSMGFVWSAIHESDRSGAVYWFDPLEFEVAEAAVTPAALLEQLRLVTDQLGRAIGGR
jgi:hypothetical protein